MADHMGIPISPYLEGEEPQPGHELTSRYGEPVVVVRRAHSVPPPETSQSIAARREHEA